jgi:hypothetical protein
MPRVDLTAAGINYDALAQVIRSQPAARRAQLIANIALLWNRRDVNGQVVEPADKAQRLSLLNDAIALAVSR